MASHPYEGLQDFVSGLPEFVQPLIVAGLGMIPYIEGEGSAALGILAGIDPIVAAIAGAAGNILSVVIVVLLSSRVRASVRARRTVTAEGATAVDVLEPRQHAPSDDTKPTRRSKGRQRLGAWMVRFGVPGASILAPLALPTQLTAAFFVASGVNKGWVILWQVVAIVLWTGLVAAAALGVVSLLGWG
ncbi:small multidrug efflux protein [Microbacterium sp. LWS13-1.2]|uniref:Small multidrug efflux protein n=1 Tax=Microbacterium sp. LWS13-1.2 TaxID=3135264 RepID=A0AAU6SE36_9MICO